MKLKGTIKRSDLEGGHWILVVDNGEQYQLNGAVGHPTDGQSVEVEGKADKNSMSFGMMGTPFTVHKLTTL